MTVRVVAVGKLRTEYARAGCDEYFSRLKKMWPLDVVEVRDAKRTRAGEPARWRAEEAEKLLAAVPAGAVVVALDERGEDWTSRKFARWLGRQRDQGRPVCFLIGGPDGLDPALRERAQKVWRLGALTMPHELARVVLAEQLYRAVTILEGRPYHRD